MAELETKSGNRVPGYLAEKPGSTAAVILIHEWWGLTDQIKRTTDRFAFEGFTTFAVDLYNGLVTTNADRANELMSQLSWDEALRTLKIAAEALQHRGASKLGVAGFCMGGALALAAAARMPPLFDAVVPFYGLPPKDRGDLAKITARVQGHFANIDDWCTPERVKASEALIKGAEFHRYEANHAFANDARPEVYSREDAEAAYSRTFAFLRTHLR